MKTKFITISATVMIGMGGLFSVPAVKAESVDSQRLQIQSSIDQAENELSSLQAQRTDIEAQINRIEQAIKDNNLKMEETNAQITETQAEIERLNSEVAVIEERIVNRREILKGRAVSFQENGGQIGYIEVILGSSSFSDFIDRVGAVATIVEADQGILKEHEADKNELEEKQHSVQVKLTDLNNMKTELEGMQAQITEQKAQSEEMKAQLVQQEQENISELAGLKQRDADLAAQKAAVKAATRDAVSETSNSQETSRSQETSSTPKKSSGGSSVSNTTVASGSLSTVINAGYKYIGNSVYVFGGGRTASDIANGRFDCSAFVSWAFSQAGVRVGASTDILKNTGTRVSVSEMRPGDMVFFNTYKTDGHVGIYIGGGKFIGSQSSTGVAVANMSSGYWADTFNGRVMRVMN
ncbi:NlpC/P60 family protein [Bacillus sp. V3B]|uniref:coiled-coil domain-containing protein n=1 Tax=Bacillus sp. V3B TaxID=2804915 RepID=UPI00210D5057|nr:NlpC/P60 family protein [Bacillus sp. V3B]